MDEYKERLGHIFSFSKTAVSHQRITYPRHFASSVPSAAPVSSLFSTSSAAHD